ncbi:MAG: hypothetical protein KBD41_00590 [Saprospiraceae bacterium]|nr:hypothetical protein [Saprospiraceae bacterium]MBP9743852.1 hypothetical protein [Saprospiraceae bacterium]
MPQRLILISFSLFLLNGTPLFSQNSSNAILLKETEGVVISDIMADKSGQIWMATDNNGLMRYDGYEFKKYSYDPSDSTSIKGIGIIKLYEDAQKKMWLSTFDGELIRYDPVAKKFKKYNYQSLIGKKYLEPYVHIVDICTIADKLLFAVESNAPLIKSILEYDVKNDRFEIFAPGSKHPDYSYKFENNTVGHTLLIGQDAQIYELETSRDTIWKLPYCDLQQLSNQTLLGDGKYDHQNNFWILAHNPELFEFKDVHQAPTKKYSFKHLLPAGLKGFLPTALEFDQDQNIWIGSFQGLFFFNRQTEQFKKIDLPLDLNGTPYKIRKLYFDTFNTLWIGTQTGLLKYENKPVFNSYSGNSTDTAQSVKGYVVGLHQSKTGAVVIFSFEEIESNYKFFLRTLDQATNKINRLSISDILPKGANVVGEDETGVDLYNIGTDLGVYQINIKTKQINKINLPGVPVTHPGIRQFFKDKNGNEWLGSTNYLYKKLKDEDAYKVIDLSTQPGGSEQSNSMLVENGGQHGLWILSENGLFLYDYITDKITRHGYDPRPGKSFIAQTINSTFSEDSSNVVWVGIKDGGLNRYNTATGEIKTYTTQDGLPNMNVNKILHDDKNNVLWLGTDGGISRFNINSEKFTNYSAGDGINGRIFFSGLKTQDGQMFIGGDALIRFNPDDIKSGSIPPIVSITDVKVSNRSIATSLDSLTINTILELKYNQNNISIDYLGVHYTDPQKNKFSYILEGFDAEWNDIPNQHTAYYTNLPTGDYTFKVKAANSNGEWNEAGAGIKIIILPPWWRTKMAYLMYVLGLLGLVKLGNQYYKQYVLRQERARSQFKELAQAREIEKAYKDLEISHKSLQTTQAQLIQSEKMASLGELTAGIAHEIQNPLNFVNNFAELNTELVKEIDEQLAIGNEQYAKGNPQQAITHLQQAKDLIKDIKANSDKINHHGKRAESIVKGMLEHSRTSTGQKEWTDINALAAEYLRLSYQGLRAKSNNFNSEIITDFEPNLPKVQVVSQDIGRVLLNLINNGFQAINEKIKSGVKDYKPALTVSTKMQFNKIVISIKDNGPGIPEDIRDKIFQPFFTTKPTGQGTGLGLSLAYDIVTKGHGGSIECASVEGERTEFIITFPIQSI